jgi:uncharacterized protein (TIGR03663 family)
MLAWLVVFATNLVVHFWDLGDRAMSHDESLHTYYSWQLYRRADYRHDPMMHGPFLFHANALAYLLFGVSDFTARIVPAVLGTTLVMLPLLLRRWLGRYGALFTAVMLLISPVILYHGRYVRDTIYMSVFTLLMFTAFFRFLDSSERRWIYVAGVSAILAIATMEVAFIHGFIFVTFILTALVLERLDEGRRNLLLYIALAAAAGLIIGGSYLAVGGVTLSVPTGDGSKVALTRPGAVMQGSLLVGGILLMLVASGWLLRRYGRRDLSQAVSSITWPDVAGVAVVVAAVYLLLFSTFFTNPDGIRPKGIPAPLGYLIPVGGITNSIQYWLGEQTTQRGGQPWYYYVTLMSMYEFLPLLLGMVGMVVYYVRSDWRNRGGQALTPGLEREAAKDREGAKTGGSLTPRGRGGVASEGEPDAATRLFVPMLVAWVVGSLWIYSWAGEKMPWLLVHPTLPLCILGGRFLGDLVSAVDWQKVRSAGWQFSGLLVLALVTLAVLLSRSPLGGVTLGELQQRISWLLGLISLVAVGYGLAHYARMLGLQTAKVAFLTLVGLMFLATIRTSVYANYINDELANEYIVYAHGTPDDKQVVEELELMQLRLGQEEPLTIGYDNETSWPFTWYLRADAFPGQVYLDKKPSSVEQMVVLFGQENYNVYNPLLGDRYVCREYRRMWWPNEGYKNQTPKKIVEQLSTPEGRSRLMNILLYRKYQRDLNDWYHRSMMRMCVRADVLTKLWPEVAASPDLSEDAKRSASESLEQMKEIQTKRVDLQAVATWSGQGSPHGPLLRPKGLALGPDGRLYIADAGNSRVAVMDATGQMLSAFGSFGETDGAGKQPPGGQFHEPWGLEVAADGTVYVADTWNNRVQKLSSGLRFLLAWGVGGDVATPEGMFGPRETALDTNGRILVADTGNKRIQAFDASGRFVRSVGGGGGSGDGQFNEPSGVAVSPTSGEIFVADMWNRRIQRFGRDYAFIAAWRVDIGWESRDAIHKPQIAVGPDDAVYVTDPEHDQVVVYSNGGQLLAIFGEGVLKIPTGVVVGVDGRVYVSSTDDSQSVVTVFNSPLEAVRQKEAAEQTAAGQPTETAQELAATPTELAAPQTVDEQGAPQEPRVPIPTPTT